MLTKRLTFALGKQLCERSCFPNNTLAQSVRGYSVEHEKRQYKWREKEDDAVTSKIGDDPEKPKTFFWFPTAAPKETDFSLGTIMKWYRYHKVQYNKTSQAFNPERHEILGANLATAHFLVHRGGRVRFKGNSYWTERDEKGRYQLPNTYDPSYVLEAVDINGFDLHYEGLSNLCGLMKLKWLSLKDCKNIDDWGLDKISAEFPKLEYLDISGCEKITERGLECLYRMTNLKKLIVTNHYKTVAFELACFMLEDCIPGLTCEILIPDKKPKD
ncbi:distal membrane-arm assembly complex protein 2 [Solenopsis invicta]|uniref:distal membrane-arm assembly complex protein 2 n=1 Tax=Solenopsis invicta TaxID=13686 RepID=UPI0001FEB94A|nr:distal membrane-arm assembly complex protein 2 [Solenopsis invicta]XP_025988953.1 distal membrane-arm assembly complex protein 2 [Solenopsis invicta]